MRYMAYCRDFFWLIWCCNKYPIQITLHENIGLWIYIAVFINVEEGCVFKKTDFIQISCSIAMETNANFEK